MLGASTGLLWRGEVPPGAAAAAGAACLRLLLESPLEDGGLVILPVWVGQSCQPPDGMALDMTTPGAGEPSGGRVAGGWRGG